MEELGAPEGEVAQEGPAKVAGGSRKRPRTTEINQRLKKMYRQRKSLVGEPSAQGFSMQQLLDIVHCEVRTECNICAAIFMLQALRRALDKRIPSRTGLQTHLSSLYTPSQMGMALNLRDIGSTQIETEKLPPIRC